MSDPVNKPRQPVDLDEFERRLRGGEPAFPAGPSFGAPDPYGQPVQGQYQQPAYPQPSYPPQAAMPQAGLSAPVNDPLAELARIIDGLRNAPFGRQEPSLPRATPLGGGWNSLDQNGDLHPDLRGGGYGGQELPPYPQHAPHGQAGAPYSASSWPAEEQAWETPEEAPPRRSSKKFLLMGAAALVVVGGIGATFATRGGGTASKTDVPTIKAASGPMKVTPEPVAPANNSEPARNASVLERGASERLTSSRVVNNEEQPVDLSQVRAAAAQPPATASSGSSPAAANAARPAGIFPEPIKVKTVSVRPDGTIVTAVTTPAPAPAPTSLAPAAGASRQVSSTPTGSTPAAAPVPAPNQRSAASAPAPTPAAAPAAGQKSTERASSTPLPVPGSGSSTSSDLPRQLASAQPAPAPAPAAAAAGGFAVQFSAAASEQEAREKIAATQRRFGDVLGNRVPTFVKGEAGSRTVWRVRVGGMSREEASSMCQRIKGQGGDCFVAAN